MHDIDFLPIEYRQKHEQLQSQPWQVVVAAAIIGLVAAAAIVQHYHWQHVQEELAIITPVYDTATNLQNRLADVTKRLDRNRANEELYTYLINHSLYNQVSDWFAFVEAVKPMVDGFPHWLLPRERHFKKLSANL